MTLKNFARQWLPPAVLGFLRGRRPVAEAIRFTGDYASWAEARRDSSGYDSPVILERTRAALLQVKNGAAGFERDSVLLPVPEPPLQVIAGLLRAAAEQDGRLHVVDFGGSLGSTYFQCRSFLAPLAALKWGVVEQPAHVACGQREFADERLEFFPDLSAALLREPPDVLLLSSVLPFLPAPHDFLAKALRHRFRYVIVDRTFFHAGPADRLTVEQVPAWIYPASYPAWFFAEPPFRAAFAADYELLAEFPSRDEVDLPGTPAWSRGMIYRLKP
jgi:putative methyltransferase (TIGR04325 family)